MNTGTGFWGPTPASQQTAFGTKGRGGELAWNLSIPAGGQTLWLGVAGSHTGAAPAVSALKAGLANPLGLLRSKVAARDATAALTAPLAVTELLAAEAQLGAAAVHRLARATADKPTRLPPGARPRTGQVAER